ncbi:MAG TPA: glutamyl-tRNA reductase [Longimicrobiales bacterium]|nr:glutamyl-tRNA reductase [Longimicrobiales bacterium]
MALWVVGISHHTAPLEVRERFVVGEHESGEVLRDLVAAGCDEAVLLSTCNRTELYLYAPAVHVEGPEVGLRTLCHRSGLNSGDAERYLYTLHDEKAARHLMRVVGSLDSMVLGEAQIQGQVRDAYRRAVEIGGDRLTVGPVLSRLFESALATGGRVRSETGLGTGAASVPSAAVELARKIFGRLTGRSAVVLGAGEMSGLVVRCLQAEGAATVMVTNRSGEDARVLEDAHAVTVVAFDRLPELLEAADLVVSATSAPHAVLTRDMVAGLGSRKRRPLMVMDIALPRDVEPEVGELANVFLYDLDDLNQVVKGTLERRRSEIELAEALIEKGTEDFRAWYRSRDVVPLIRGLRERAESVRRHEVERALRRLGPLTPEQRDAVDVLTRQLLAKVLHEPTTRLREAMGRDGGENVVEAARFLFGIEEPGANCNGAGDGGSGEE